jgi:hypothetical protein
MLAVIEHDLEQPLTRGIEQVGIVQPRDHVAVFDALDVAIGSARTVVLVRPPDLYVMAFSCAYS